jgi:ribosomal protein L37AE/L43A
MAGIERIDTNLFKFYYFYRDTFNLAKNKKISSDSNFKNDNINKTKKAETNELLTENKLKKNQPSVKTCPFCGSMTYMCSSGASATFSSEASINAVDSHEASHIKEMEYSAFIEGKRAIVQYTKINIGSCPFCGKTYATGGEARVTIVKEDNLPTKNSPLNIFKNILNIFRPNKKQAYNIVQEKNKQKQNEQLLNEDNTFSPIKGKRFLYFNLNIKNLDLNLQKLGNLIDVFI